MRQHTLQPDETLRQVAQRYGVSGAALLAANPQLDFQNGLYAGITINIPAPTIAPVPATRLSPRSFDVPESAYAPNPGVPAAPGALAPPAAPGVQLGRSPPRTFFGDPNTRALPPQPMTWPHPERPLQLGARNPEVEIIQRALCRIGYVLRVDGEFGGATDAAIRHFQQLMGLPANGTMTPQTWSRLRSAMEAIRQPQQVLVSASRDAFTTTDERNAYDILLALAYDEPGSNQSSDMGMRELLRVMRIQVGTPVNITPELVTAFARRAIEVGLPLNAQALAPLDPMRLDTSSDRLNYNQARAVSELFIRMLRGSRINDTTYDRLIIRYARQYNLEPELVKAFMAIESDFSPNLTSSAGARGLMQVMPDTASFVGMTSTTDPEQNIHAGVRYLAYLSERFGGDLVYMAAGYNSGPNRVARNGGVPPIQETYDYVRRFLAHYSYYRQRPVR
ncbi:MAG: transglycosylase SLT domain-containing protein [Myxococcota bacterium]|nr:transglycosylase SLT domain-containing protein [Myxococcota bacterium]